MIFFLFTKANDGICFSEDGTSFYASDDMRKTINKIEGAISNVRVIQSKGGIFEKSVDFLRNLLSHRISVLEGRGENLTPISQRVVRSVLEAMDENQSQYHLLAGANLGGGCDIVFIPEPVIYIEKRADIKNLADVVRNILKSTNPA